jgi:primosomal protein N' (replication factor Y)
VTLARHGAGTERVASLITAALDPLPVFRLDSDSTGAAGHDRVLAAFDTADAGVLVGTQMVAKGHDFPDVVLGVVLDADATLRFPDFRSEERTFSLVAQLAGRTGRGPRGGRVFVQTLAPDADCIRSAARHDTAGFLAGELERRKALGYPPYSNLVRLEVSSPDSDAALAACERLGARVAPLLPSDATMLGPAPRMRLRGRNRFQLLIKARRRAPALEAVRAAVSAGATAGELRAVALAVDADPS